MRPFLLFILILFLVPLQLLYLYSQNDGKVAGISQQSEPILNSILIGEYHFSLFGYTSPSAQVNFNGQGIADWTIADSTGYFEFKNRFSPFSPREACLSARDQFGRLSVPVCLPPFPTQYNVTIGPVIIPPTISLDKPNYFTGDEVILTGQTIPNENVNLSIFTEPQKSFLAVEAFSIPRLTTKSDSKGNFSISLPSSSAQNYRLFTQVDYQDSQSPNSLLLKVKILPVWMIVFRFFGFVWNILSSRLLEVMIALEIIGLAAYFLRVFLQPHYLVSRKKAIIPYENHSSLTVKDSRSIELLRNY